MIRTVIFLSLIYFMIKITSSTNLCNIDKNTATCTGVNLNYMRYIFRSNLLKNIKILTFQNSFIFLKEITKKKQKNTWT
jgi:hypothetical protein